MKLIKAANGVTNGWGKGASWEMLVKGHKNLVRSNKCESYITQPNDTS